MRLPASLDQSREKPGRSLSAPALICTLTFLALICLTPASRSQSASPIGQFLTPWTSVSPLGFAAMTADGEWIAFVDSEFGCETSDQRISMIRSDGSGYRQVVSPTMLVQLQTDGHTQIIDFGMSGDGSRGFFSRPDNDLFCFLNGQIHHYLVDMASGEVVEFEFVGFDTSSLSFTDDGSEMAFLARDPGSGAAAFHRANADGSQATPFLDAVAWHSAFGRLSGDGSHFAFVGQHNSGFSPADVYVYEFASSTLTRVSPAPVGGLASVSVSADGSRVAYGGLGFGVYAVNADGTDHHQVAGQPASGSTTLSRDGEWVFFVDSFGFPPAVQRVRWDGSELAATIGTSPFFGQNWPVPVSADGSRHACFLPEVDFAAPLGVWFENPPVLTAYGHGTVGTTLTFDVGGDLGDTYLLAYSLRPGNSWTPFGTLLLGRRTLGVLAMGTVDMPNLNVGRASFDLDWPFRPARPIPIYFQALVRDPTGLGTLTNRTMATLKP